MSKTKVAVIGLGAAGMMAAYSLLESEDCEVLAFERNKNIGAKVLISGGGRCNVTTYQENIPEILKNYPRGAKFLRFAMYEIPPLKIMQFFEKNGVKLKHESDLRVFPASDDGSEIVNVFEKKFKKSGAKIKFLNAISDIEKVNGKFILTNQKNEKFEAEKVIITTGGQAYRHTGSKGDGYFLAERLGHSITDLGPSLNSFVVKDNWSKELSGVSHIEVNFKGFLKDGKKLEFKGPMIWTHRGLSGPAVFAVSAMMAFERFDKLNSKEIYLDLIPSINHEELNAKLTTYFKANPKKSLLNAFKEFAPRSVLLKLASELELDMSKIIAETSKKKIAKLINLLKHLPIELVGRASGDEFVTAGGIKLEEINKKTMESKICNGLFFAGEILDVDGFTGGYNLQASWATGYIAGNSASKNE